MAVVRWKFTDVWGTGPTPHSYTFHINPNQASSAQVEKSFNLQGNAGGQGIIVQEGRMTVPQLQFSGVIVKREHFEALELWFIRRIVLDLEDDLGRLYRGIFASFAPERPYRPRNFWYHTYTASFQTMAYRNASGQVLYGRFV